MQSGFKLFLFFEQNKKWQEVINYIYCKNKLFYLMHSIIIIIINHLIRDKYIFCNIKYFYYHHHYIHTILNIQCI